jgi:hypothetical protein
VVLLDQDKSVGEMIMTLADDYGEQQTGNMIVNSRIFAAPLGGTE